MVAPLLESSNQSIELMGRGEKEGGGERESGGERRRRRRGWIVTTAFIGG